MSTAAMLAGLAGMLLAIVPVGAAQRAASIEYDFVDRPAGLPAEFVDVKEPPSPPINPQPATTGTPGTTTGNNNPPPETNGGG